MGLKGRLKRVQDRLRGNAVSIELTNGSRRWFDPESAFIEVFRHASDSLTADYRGEPRPEPPEVLEAIASAGAPKELPMFPVAGRWIDDPAEDLSE